MAKKTDSTVDDPDLLEDGGQFIPEYRPPDYEVIGADGGLFSGGLGKSGTNLADVLKQDITYASGYRPGQGIFVNPEESARLGVDQGNIFLSNPNFTGFLTPPSTVSAGPAAPAATTPAVSTVRGAPTMPEDTPFGKIYNEELARRNAVRAAAGQQPISATDVAEITQLADWAVKEQDKLFGEQDSDAQRQARAKAAVAAKQTGIPLVVPIPGLDQTTALILTAAGFILSGGNVATFDPNNPVQSVIDAGKGTVATIQKAGDVITGQTDIFGNQTGSGASGANVGAGQTPSISTPVVVGAGILSGATGGTGPFVGPVGAQQQTGGTVGVTPGALGGQTTASTTTTTVGSTVSKPSGDMPQTGGPYILSDEQKAAIANSQVMDILLGGAAARQAVAEQNAANTATAIVTTTTATSTSTTTATTTATATSTTTSTTTDDVTNTGTTVLTTTCPAGQTKDANGNCVPITTSCQPGYEKNAAGVCVPITFSTSTSTATTTATTTPTTPIFQPMPAFTFTKTTPGDLAMRDFEKEFGLTSSTLMGQPGKDLANFYQQLQSQFTPSTLTQLAGTSQQQLMSDLDRLAMAQRGQLSPEDVRSAQQSAREAYAARGQVMAPGAIGAEILNRDVLRRQREAEARANLQQSMSNVGAAAQLQTGNIFAPFANLLAKTYGPTNEYANAVYDYNVNAYNAYQAAQENLAAYKEAAAKGQQAEFISTFANFLAKNGVATTWNALENIFKKIGGTPGSP
jgi:hypothetical protein